MCKVIFESKYLKGKNGHPDPTSPEDIFNYSPTGELYNIYEWYEIATTILYRRMIWAREVQGGPPSWLSKIDNDKFTYFEKVNPNPQGYTCSYCPLKEGDCKLDCREYKIS